MNKNKELTTKEENYTEIKVIIKSEESTCFFVHV